MELLGLGAVLEQAGLHPARLLPAQCHNHSSLKPSLVLILKQPFLQAFVRFSVCLAVIWMLWKAKALPVTGAQ